MPNLSRNPQTQKQNTKQKPSNTKGNTHVCVFGPVAISCKPFVGWSMPVACGLEYARRLWAGVCPSLVGWNMPVACGLEYARRLWVGTL